MDHEDSPRRLGPKIPEKHTPTFRLYQQELEFDACNKFLRPGPYSATRLVDLPMAEKGTFRHARVSIKYTVMLTSRDKCVEEQSATYHGKNVENLPLAVDHYVLDKFSSRNPEYNSILDALNKSLKATGTICGIYSAPFQTVDTFTPRIALQDEIWESMRRNDHDQSLVAVTVSGLGGNGKTQLALDYLQSVKDKFDPILWIDAKDFVTTRSSFERCARALNSKLPDAQTSLAEAEIGDLPIVHGDGPFPTVAMAIS